MSRTHSESVTFITGIICFMIPASIYGFWIHAVNQADIHEERVRIFRSYFPEFLQGRFDTTYVSIIFLAAAIWLFTRVIGKSEGNLKYITIAFLVFSGFLLFLNVFSLM